MTALRVLITAISVMLGLSCASRTPIEDVIATAFRTPYEQAHYEPSSGDSHAGALARLEARLQALGVSVLYGPSLDGGAVGMASIEHRTIWIDQRLAPNGRLEVLAHEAGHVFQPWTLTPSEGQVFAELVGTTVCYRLGWDVRKASGTWMGAYKAGIDGALAHQLEIDRAVAILLGEVEP